MPGTVTSPLRAGIASSDHHWGHRPCHTDKEGGSSRLRSSGADRRAKVASVPHPGLQCKCLLEGSWPVAGGWGILRTGVKSCPGALPSPAPGSTQRHPSSGVHLPIHLSVIRSVLTTSPHPVTSECISGRSPPGEQGRLACEAQVLAVTHLPRASPQACRSPGLADSSADSSADSNGAGLSWA